MSSTEEELPLAKQRLLLEIKRMEAVLEDPDLSENKRQQPENKLKALKFNFEKFGTRAKLHASGKAEGGVKERLNFSVLRRGGRRLGRKH